jgi:hypothetical protein
MEKVFLDTASTIAGVTADSNLIYVPVLPGFFAAAPVVFRAL